MHKVCGQTTVKFEAVLQFEQQWLLFTKALAWPCKDKEAEEKWSAYIKDKWWRLIDMALLTTRKPV